MQPQVYCNGVMSFIHKKDKAHWTMEVADLVEKISWCAKILKHFLKKKAKLAPWMEKNALNLLAQIGDHCVLWISSKTNVLPLLGGDNQGGCGVVCKMQIKKLDYIQNTIQLTGEIPKIDDKRQVHKQQLVEALACPCKHLGVIKFFAIHA
jgi:hypothetical protein